MRTKIIALLLVVGFSLVACGVTEISSGADDLASDIGIEQLAENSQDESAQQEHTETDTDTDTESSYDEQKKYREHIKKANETIRKICAEMADKNWERITCFHYIPEDFCEYEGYKVDFQDFRDLYIESAENPEAYYYTIIGSIPGRGGAVSRTPLLVVLILSFDEENPEGKISRVYYNTISGFSYEEPWINPAGNVICDAYDALLWDEIYAPM